MTVYLDVVFIENIVMNYMILLATGIILKKKISHIRIFASSFLGSLYVVVSYITNFQTLYGIVMKILLSMAMIYIAFNSNNIKIQIKELLTFYLVSFAFGGTAFAMIYFIKPQNIMIKNGVYIGRYAFGAVSIGVLIGFILINIVFKLVKRRISKEDMYCKIKVEFNNKSKIINTIIDSGNMLKDPISRKPVIIVEKDVLKEIIPKLIIENINRILGGDSFVENEEVEKYLSVFKLIPFKSLGKEHRINFRI